MKRNLAALLLTSLLWLPNTIGSVTGQTKSAKTTGTVSGSVVLFPGGKGLLHSRVKFIGPDFSIEVVTQDDGAYIANLPVGKYRVEAARAGFGWTARAPLTVTPGSESIINFFLVPWAITDTVDEHPFAYDTVTLDSIIGGQAELGIQFATKTETEGAVTYSGGPITYCCGGSSGQANAPFTSKYIGVVLSYERLTVYADKLQLLHDGRRVLAEGNVVVEDNGKTSRGNRTEIWFDSEQPSIRVE